MTTFFVVLLGLAAFVYVATNVGDRRGQGPGWQPVFVLIVVVVIAYVAWPLIGPIATWFVAPITASYYGR